MIGIDKTLFRRIFRRIFKAYVDHSGVFKELRAENFGPQNLYMPKGVETGNRDHLYWLTLVALSDKRTNSAMLYYCFAKMFSRNKNLFKRGEYPTLSRMTELFRAYKIALPVMEIAFFIERKRHLDELFGGDPLNIFVGTHDIDELMVKFDAIARQNGIANLFPGAKKKIFSLLAMFLSEFTELQFADVVPIDVWVQSIANSTSVLTGEGQIDINTLEQMLRPLMTSVFSEFKHLKGTSNATWIHGRALCTNCGRVNTSSLCSVYEECKGPFKRMRHPVSGKLYGRIQVPADFMPKGIV